LKGRASVNDDPSAVMGGFAVLKQREFTYYLGARFFSTIAAQMLIIAVGWQVYHLTGRVIDLGLIGLSQFLPFLCLSLFAGHVADQYDRGLVIKSCLAVFLVSTLSLLVFATKGLQSTLPIFGVLGVLGIGRAFLTPAGQSFVPNLVPTSALGNAVALSSTSFQVATIAGPSLGGLIYALGQSSNGVNGGAVWVYGASGVMLSASLIMMLRVKRRPKAGVRSAVSWVAVLEGLRFVWRRKTVLGAISLDLFAVLFGGATALLPAYTQNVLHAGPEVFGYLRAAPGIGAGLCALWLAFRPVNRHIGVWMFSGVAVFGVATLVFGLTRHFWVAMASLMLLGAGDMVSVFIRQLLVQLETPDTIRCRVSAVNSVFIGASNELGEFESGFTAAWFGLVPAIVVGGVVTLLVTGLWAWVLFPGLGRLRTFDQLKEGHANET
jgi:MFS family permease